jgi:trigger factor
MQVTETLADGLKRELKVVVPASELNERLAARLEELKNQVRLKGFRPGKVPVKHLKLVYGRSAMAEIVQSVLNETAQKTLTDRGEKPAMQPSYDLPEGDQETEQVLAGHADLAFSMKYEILPKVELKDFKGIKIERPIADITEADIDREVSNLAESARSYSAKEGAAEKGDRLTISYMGMIDGAPFEGGSADNAMIRLGSGQFIPGFEDQLMGATAGERRTLNVKFPDDYGATQLAGKNAEFSVTVSEVAAPGELTLDDELAKRLGVESLARLKEIVRRQVESQYGSYTRQKVKRQLLDALDGVYSFDLPPSMVEFEFNNIWNQVLQDLARANRTFADENTTEEKAREDYRRIAERRVKLGLVLSEIGERNNIQVTDEEVNRELTAYVRRFPGRERELIEAYRKNPSARASFRAPIFEEKVVDFLLELADITDKTVSKEELTKDDEDETPRVGSSA